LKRDPRKKKLDPNNITVFISLDTENLGQVDSLISINKKNVSVNMRVRDRGIIDFIKENYRELYDRMADKGYKLVDLKYRLTDEQANIMNIEEITEKIQYGNRVSIDYRL